MNYLEAVKLKELNYFPILPWGSFEPHGEHLPYTTDSDLATAVARAVGSNICTPCVLLPAIWAGSQNPGQTDRPFCIHFDIETQKAILSDTVRGLWLQGTDRLLIINGHNGNNFKGIVRDLEYEFPAIQIFVCNYLDIIDKNELKHIPFPDVDDHAAFTETSLMLYLYPEKVNMSAITDDTKDFEKPNSVLWTPRHWDEVSYYTRVGKIGEASAEYGKDIFMYIVDKIVKNISI